MQKLFKTGAIFWEKAQRVCTAVKTLVLVTSVKIRSITVQSEAIKLLVIKLTNQRYKTFNLWGQAPF